MLLTTSLIKKHSLQGRENLPDRFLKCISDLLAVADRTSINALSM
jgi:hypothetical protein